MGGVTQEALNYLSLPLISEFRHAGHSCSTGRSRLTSRTTAWRFPSATEGIKIAVGGEYRKEFLFVNPDLAYRDGYGAGQGGPTLPVEGRYNVKEFFAEGLIPLVQDARGAKDLSLELGYRLSDYNSTG